MVYGLPIERIESNSTRLVQVPPEKNFPISAIQIAHFDPVCFRVSPVEFVSNPVTCESIRRRQTCQHDILTHT